MSPCAIGLPSFIEPRQLWTARNIRDLARALSLSPSLYFMFYFILQRLIIFGLFSVACPFCVALGVGLELNVVPLFVVFNLSMEPS